MGTDPSHFACQTDQKVRTLRGGTLGLYWHTQLVTALCHNSRSYTFKRNDDLQFKWWKIYCRDLDCGLLGNDDMQSCRWLSTFWRKRLEEMGICVSIFVWDLRFRQWYWWRLRTFRDVMLSCLACGYLMFWRIIMPAYHRKLLNQQHNITSQKTWNFTFLFFSLT